MLGQFNHHNKTIGQASIETNLKGKVMSFSQSNQRLLSLLVHQTPFILGRTSCGAELCLLVTDLTRRPITDSSCHTNQPHLASGIYPQTGQGLRAFLDVYEGALGQLSAADMVFVNGCTTPGDSLVLPLFAPHLLNVASPVPISRAHADCRSGKMPWTSGFAHKTVLVLHPFTETIACQLRVRNELHAGCRWMIPSTASFKLVEMFVAASAAPPHGSFAETLDATWERILQVGDFDVALIGAAAYGMPIAARIKSWLNRSALVLGGESQHLFGIRGQRWDTHQTHNAKWIYPLHNDQMKLASAWMDHMKGTPYGSSMPAMKVCPHPEH